MVKYGPRDQSVKKKKIIRGQLVKARTVNALTNAELTDKSKFRPKEYGKVEAIQRNRGVTWAVED